MLASSSSGWHHCMAMDAMQCLLRVLVLLVVVVHMMLDMSQATAARPHVCLAGR
jgi:hypothetical protein